MWRAVERWGSQIKSGLNFDFLSRLFSRQKSYSQFESTEDIFSDAKEDLESSEDEDDIILMRDSDPYEVSYERRRNKKKHDVQIHATTSGERANGNTKTNKDSDLSESNGTDSLTVRYTSGHHRQGSTVREDVGGFVTCVIQRQYSKLDNEVSDDDHKTSDQDQQDGAFCDNNKQADSNVFHSIKDVDPNWKAKKPKRRKKVRVFQFLRRITSFTSRYHAYARTK